MGGSGREGMGGSGREGMGGSGREGMGGSGREGWEGVGKRGWEGGRERVRVKQELKLKEKNWERKGGRKGRGDEAGKEGEKRDCWFANCSVNFCVPKMSIVLTSPLFPSCPCPSPHPLSHPLLIFPALHSFFLLLILPYLSPFSLPRFCFFSSPLPPLPPPPLHSLSSLHVLLPRGSHKHRWLLFSEPPFGSGGCPRRGGGVYFSPHGVPPSHHWRSVFPGGDWIVVWIM